MHGFYTNLREIVLILIKYSCKILRRAIVNSMNLDINTVLSIIDKVMTKLSSADFSDNKLGGPRFIV